MRQHLNPPAQVIYDRYVLAAIRGGCDRKQAEQIAKERYIEDANRASEARRQVLPSR